MKRWKRPDLAITNIENQFGKGNKLTDEHKEILRQYRLTHPLSEESRKKIAKTLTGRKLSPETRQKMCKAHKGHKTSTETREKIRQSMLGKQNSKGYKMSPEHRQKLLESNHSRKLTDESKQKIGRRSKGNHYAKGRKHTPEEIAKMRGRIVSSATREKNRQNWIANIKKIRKEGSSCERQMKAILEELGIEYEQDVFLPMKKYNYPIDFLLPKQKIVIEVDGTPIHFYPLGRPIDLKRTRELESMDYRVIRFWHSCGKKERDGTIQDFNIEQVRQKIFSP